MDQETFNKEIFDKTRVNETANLFADIAGMRAQIINRFSAKRPEKVDNLDIISLIAIMGAGNLSNRQRAVLQSIGPCFVDQLADIGDRLNRLQHQLAQVRKINTDKLREFVALL